MNDVHVNGELPVDIVSKVAEQVRAHYGPRVEGKTPWEFANEWYGKDEIAKSIANTRSGGFGAGEKIPTNVFSMEFAEWLQQQYCLAMRKGIELGWDAAKQATACPGCGRHAPYCDCDPSMYTELSVK